MLTRMEEMRWKNPGLLGFVQILDLSAYVTASLDLLTPTVVALALLTWELTELQNGLHAAALVGFTL